MPDLRKEAVEEARKLAAVLNSKHLRASAAESCTGGLIGATITSLPGSSAYFMGSCVTYSNEAKEDILGVPFGIVMEYGAVSSRVAELMAKGSVRIYHSDLAVAVTGIAGPGGATAAKPVGLVYIGVSDGKSARSERFVFPGDRSEVRGQTVVEALRMLTELAEELRCRPATTGRSR